LRDEDGRLRPGGGLRGRGFLRRWRGIARCGRRRCDGGLGRGRHGEHDRIAPNGFFRSSRSCLARRSND